MCLILICGAWRKYSESLAERKPTPSLCIKSFIERSPYWFCLYVHDYLYIVHLGMARDVLLCTSIPKPIFKNACVCILYNYVNKICSWDVL